MKIEHGQVAVVTGAGSGIGLAVCRKLAAHGVRLVMADIDEQRLSEAAETIAGPVATARCDVSLPEEVEGLHALAISQFGQVDMVFNNAGVVLPFRPMWENTAKQWDWLLGINLGGVINGIRTFVPKFVEQGSGHIVNTASMAGVMVLPFNGVYNASKHAVVSLTETLAGELAEVAPGVHASVICPGRVPTNIAPREQDGAAPLSRDAIAPDAETNRADASEAAQRIVAGVESNAVYIFTNPGSAARIVARHEAIMASLGDRA